MITDYVTGACTYQDLPYTGGLINVSWTKSSPYSYKSHGRTEYDIGNFKYVNQGRFEYTSANVEGELFGVPIASADGRVGAAREMTLTITKTH